MNIGVDSATTAIGVDNCCTLHFLYILSMQLYSFEIDSWLSKQTLNVEHF